MSTGPSAPRPGRMTRVAQALLVLYPRRWRDRYGAEMRELLAQHRVLAWRALAGTDLTDTVIRAFRITAAVAATAMAAGLLATGIEASLLRAYAPALIGIGWLAAIGTGMLAATVMTGLALPQMTRTTRPRPGR